MLFNLPSVSLAKHVKPNRNVSYLRETLYLVVRFLINTDRHLEELGYAADQLAKAGAFVSAVN